MYRVHYQMEIEESSGSCEGCSSYERQHTKMCRRTRRIIILSRMVLTILGAITFVVAAIVNRIEVDTPVSLVYVVVSSVYLLAALLDITHHIIRCHMVGKFVVE